jgi:hypothetical protein
VFLVAHFLGEEVSWVEGTRDVDWLYLSQLDGLADTALADVELAHIARDSLRVDPSNGALVVTVEERGTSSGDKLHSIQAAEHIY